MNIKKNVFKIKYFVLIFLGCFSCLMSYSQHYIETIYYSGRAEPRLFKEMTVEKYNLNNELIEETICKNSNHTLNVSEDSLIIERNFYKHLNFNDTIKTYFSKDQIDWNLVSIRINKTDSIRVMKHFYPKGALFDTLYIKENNLLKSIWVKKYGKDNHTKHMDYFYNDKNLTSKILYYEEKQLAKYEYSLLKEDGNFKQIRHRFDWDNKTNSWQAQAEFINTLIYSSKSFPKLLKEVTISPQSGYNHSIIYSYKRNLLFQIDDFYNDRLDNQTRLRKLKKYKLKSIIKKAEKLFKKKRKQYNLYNNSR